MTGANLLGAAAVADMFDDVADQFGSDETYVVGTNVEYGPYVELGTSRQSAQPYLFPAAQKVADQDFDRIVANAGGTEAVVSTLALEIEREAKLRVPVLSGNLKGSIRAEKL